MTTHTQNTAPILLIGGNGKTGRRVAERLRALGRPVRTGSRSTEIPFAWEDESTWEAALDGVSAAYVTYYPDLAFPGATEAVGRLAAFAVARGVRRLVLLAGRGEEGAVAGEDALKASGCDWTIVRAGWFNQNFSESFFLDPVRSGELVLPPRTPSNRSWTPTTSPTWSSPPSPTTATSAGPTSCPAPGR